MTGLVAKDLDLLFLSGLYSANRNMCCSCCIQETYYVPPLDEGPSQKISKGKLVDKYRNQRKLLKAAGAIDNGPQEVSADCSSQETGYSLHMHCDDLIDAE